MNMVLGLLPQAKGFLCCIPAFTCLRLWQAPWSLFVMAEEAPKTKLCQHNDLLLHTNPFKVLRLRVGKHESFLSDWGVLGCRKSLFKGSNFLKRPVCYLIWAELQRYQFYSSLCLFSLFIFSFSLFSTSMIETHKIYPGASQMFPFMIHFVLISAFIDATGCWLPAVRRTLMFLMLEKQYQWVFEHINLYSQA